MKVIYFDCTNGISGDMAYAALLGLLGEGADAARAEIEKLGLHEHSPDDGHGHKHESGHGHKHESEQTCGREQINGQTHEHGRQSDNHSHRGYSEIKNIINSSGISASAKEKALSIYSVIAEAEASVHGTTVCDVHFHEVGRDKAIENIVGAAVCIDAMGVEKILCSAIYDGKGFVECSHGTIPVPVPAVMAMREKCGLTFETDENVNTEMVTPSGLAMLVGLGAEYSGEIPQGAVLRKAVARGGRETGRGGGLSAYLVELE